MQSDQIRKILMRKVVMGFASSAATSFWQEVAVVSASFPSIPFFRRYGKYNNNLLLILISFLQCMRRGSSTRACLRLGCTI